MDKQTYNMMGSQLSNQIDIKHTDWINNIIFFIAKQIKYFMLCIDGKLLKVVLYTYQQLCMQTQMTNDAHFSPLA